MSYVYFIDSCFCGHFVGYKEEEFNWSSYLKTCKAQAAPKSLFENQNTVSIPNFLLAGSSFYFSDSRFQKAFRQFPLNI